MVLPPASVRRLSDFGRQRSLCGKRRIKEMRRAFAIFAAVMVGVPIHAQELARVGGWSSSGLPFPVVYTIATPEDDARVVYAGASPLDTSVGALFQSSDRGTSWIDLADAPVGETVTSLAIDPHETRNMIASTRHLDLTTTLYRSTDRGLTWYQGLNIEVGCGAITFDRVTDSAFVACGDRLFRSDDAGITWLRLVSPASDIYGVATGPDGSVFAFSFSTIYRTQSAGSSWSLVARAPEPCPNISVLAVSPDAPETLYVGTGAPTFQHLLCGGVFRSLDGGATWSSLELGLYISDILIDRREPTRVFASAINCCGFFSVPGGVFMSTDGGSTWKDLRVPYSGAGELALSASGEILYAVAAGLQHYPLRRSIVVPPR